MHRQPQKEIILENPFQTLGLNRERIAAHEVGQALALATNMYKTMKRHLSLDTLKGRKDYDPTKPLKEQADSFKLAHSRAQALSERLDRAYAKLTDPKRLPELLHHFRPMSLDDQIAQAQASMLETQSQVRSDRQHLGKQAKEFLLKNPRSVPQWVSCEVHVKDIVSALCVTDVCGDSDLARFVDRASHRKLIVDERGFVQIDEAEAAYKTDKRLMFLVPIAKDQNDAEALTNLGLRCLESDHLIRVAGDTEDHSLIHRRFHKDGLPTTSSIVATRESSFAVSSAPQASAYFYKLLDSATFLLGDPAQDKLLLVSTYTDKRYDNVRAMEIEGYVTNVNFFEKPAAPRTNSATPEAKKTKSAAKSTAKSKRRAPKTKTEEAPEKPARAKAKSTTPKKRASESSKKATPSKQKAHTEKDTGSKKREAKDRQPKKKS